MTFTAVKEKLHGYIESAEENKVMAIYSLIEGDLDAGKTVYTDEMISMLEKRSEDAFSGKSKTYTLEQSMENIRKHRKQNGI